MQKNTGYKIKKIDKLDFIKIFKYCLSKDNIKKVEKKSTEWEKDFVNYVTNEDLVSGIYIKNSYSII